MFQFMRKEKSEEEKEEKERRKREKKERKERKKVMNLSWLFFDGKLEHVSVTSHPFRKSWQTDRLTNRQTDLRTDRPGHREVTLPTSDPWSDRRSVLTFFFYQTKLLQHMSSYDPLCILFGHLIFFTQQAWQDFLDKSMETTGIFCTA